MTRDQTAPEHATEPKPEESRRLAAMLPGGSIDLTAPSDALCLSPEANRGIGAIPDHDIKI